MVQSLLKLRLEQVSNDHFVVIGHAQNARFCRLTPTHGNTHILYPYNRSF